MRAWMIIACKGVIDNRKDTECETVAAGSHSVEWFDTNKDLLIIPEYGMME